MFCRLFAYALLHIKADGRKSANLLPLFAFAPTQGLLANVDSIVLEVLDHDRRLSLELNFRKHARMRASHTHTHMQARTHTCKHARTHT